VEFIEETYLKICEAMNSEPLESETPPDVEEFLEDTQIALYIYNTLPNRWDGFNGFYLGKDLLLLPLLLDLYNITDIDLKLFTIQCMTFIDEINMKCLNEKTNSKNKATKGK